MIEGIWDLAKNCQHAQSKNLFCPVSPCEWSGAPGVKRPRLPLGISSILKQGRAKALKGAELCVIIKQLEKQKAAFQVPQRICAAAGRFSGQDLAIWF